MRIHIICPVRGVTDKQQWEIDNYCDNLEKEGHVVHNPKYAVNQSDPTGYNICQGHYSSMVLADRVDIFWISESKGSHFDLGMAFALRKPLKLVKLFDDDSANKSYVKVIKEIERIGYGK